MAFSPPYVFSPGQVGFSAKLNSTITALAAYSDGLINGFPPAASRMWLDFFTLRNDGSPVFSNYAQTTTRFKYVIMNIDQRTHVTNLKAANPNIKCLAYQEMIYDFPLMGGAVGNQGDCPSLISREEANVNTYFSPDWYARTTTAGLTSVTGVAATDIITRTAHGHVAGDIVVFTALTGGAGLTTGTTYYVIAANLAANTFQLATTPTGTAVNFTTDITAATYTVSSLVLNPFGSGGRLLRLHLPEIQAAAIVNACYRCRQNVNAIWDGVFGDDANYDIPAVAVPYTTDQQWYTGALRPFLDSFGRGLKNNGLLFFPNFGNLGNFDFLAETLPAFTNGYLDEFWTRYSGGGWNGYWYHSMLAADRAVALGGKTCLLGTQGSSNTDTTAMRSGLAHALMVVHATDPSRVAWSFTGIDHTNEKWDASFDLAIGAPTGVRAWTGTAFASGLIRYFANGVAVCNPQYNPGAPYGAGTLRTGNIVVPLTGGTYTGSGLTSVSSVTLAAGEGVVLKKD